MTALPQWFGGCRNAEQILADAIGNRLFGRIRQLVVKFVTNFEPVQSTDLKGMAQHSGVSGIPINCALKRLGEKGVAYVWPRSAHYLVQLTEEDCHNTIQTRDSRKQATMRFLDESVVRQEVLKAVRKALQWGRSAFAGGNDSMYRNGNATFTIFGHAPAATGCALNCEFRSKQKPASYMSNFLGIRPLRGFTPRA